MVSNHSFKSEKLTLQCLCGLDLFDGRILLMKCLSTKSQHHYPMNVPWHCVKQQFLTLQRNPTLAEPSKTAFHFSFMSSWHKINKYCSIVSSVASCTTYSFTSFQPKMRAMVDLLGWHHPYTDCKLVHSFYFIFSLFVTIQISFPWYFKIMTFFCYSTWLLRQCSAIISSFFNFVYITFFGTSFLFNSNVPTQSDIFLFRLLARLGE